MDEDADDFLQRILGAAPGRVGGVRRRQARGDACILGPGGIEFAGDGGEVAGDGAAVGAAEAALIGGERLGIRPVQDEFQRTEPLDGDRFVGEARLRGRCLVLAAENALDLAEGDAAAVGEEQDLLQPVVVHDRAEADELDARPACREIGEAVARVPERGVARFAAEAIHGARRGRGLVVELRVARPDEAVDGVGDDRQLLGLSCAARLGQAVLLAMRGRGAGKQERKADKRATGERGDHRDSRNACSASRSALSIAA